MWATHGSKYAGSGNQFMGVVELLELSINKKPMSMRLKVLIEAKLVEQIDKYLYSSHKHGDFGSLV